MVKPKRPRLGLIEPESIKRKGTASCGSRRTKRAKQSVVDSLSDVELDHHNDSYEEHPAKTVDAENGSDDEPKVKRPKPSIAHLILATDFGMTQSGIAISAKDSRPDDVVIRKKWPNSEGNHNKVLTVISYKSENKNCPDFEDDEQSRFGFEAPKNSKHHAFFKMALDSNAPRTRFDNPILDGCGARVLFRKSQGERGMQAVEDSLRHLAELGEDCFNKHYGYDFVSRSKMSRVLSYPSASTDEGRANLYNAAVRAGWIRPGTKDEIVMIPEADAACLAAALDHDAKFGRDNGAWSEAFRYKTLVLVIDIGGLTCDAATLRVVNNNPYKFEQACAAQGGKCGITAIYCYLHELLIEKFGNAFRNLPDELVGHGSDFLNGFEQALQRFEGRKLDAKTRLELPMPAGFEHEDYDMGRVVLTGHELKSMLDRNFAYIRAILEEQIGQPKVDGDGRPTKNSVVQTIVACGGGSLFPYLYDRLDSFCKEGRKKRLFLIQPDDPETVVAIGACISAQKTKILQKRVARNAYGITVHEPYREGNWNAKDVFFDSQGEKRLDGFMLWHIKKGLIIDTSKQNQGVSFEVSIELTSEDLEKNHPCETIIWQYSDDDAPDRYDHIGVREAGRLVFRPATMSASLKRQLKNKMQDSGVVVETLKLKQMVAVDKGQVRFEAYFRNTRVGYIDLQHEATQPVSDRKAAELALKVKAR